MYKNMINRLHVNKRMQILLDQTCFMETDKNLTNSQTDSEWMDGPTDEWTDNVPKQKGLTKYVGLYFHR